MVRRIITYLLVVLILTSVGLPTARVLAIPDPTFYSLNDILLYDPDACSPDGGGSGDTGSALVGNDNVEKALRYFVGKGLKLSQAAGIIGNFGRESGMNPAIIQGVDGKAPTLADANYKPVVGVGFGIAQWTQPASRQDGLVKLASTSNRSIIDLGLQLDYSWQELSTGYKKALENLKATTSPEDAAYVFHRDYEGSADSEETVKRNRGGDAKALFAQYRSIINDGTASTSDDAAACTGDGSASAFVDGFTIYNQSDFSKDWAALPYGPGKNVAQAGCGPSAMAMIITALTKKNVTPKDTATYGAANGTIYVEDGVGAGSLHNIHSVIGGHWGLQSEYMGRDVAKINDGLRRGGLIVISGGGSAPFTTGGHFIVIRAVTGDNKWLIGDSNGTQGIENSKKEWDPAYILSMAQSGYVWLLTYPKGGI